MRIIESLAVGLTLTAMSLGQGKPLNVCATVPDLAHLVSEIGGGEVSVTVLAKPMEDPHFVEAKPSFIKTLSTADLLVLTGMELEIGWVPPLVLNARNAAVQPGAKGYLEASSAITPLEVPTGVVDRSMGDVHPAGNPHFLLDPLNGLKVAALIKDRLTTLRPDSAKTFEERYKAFRQKIGDALVGAELAKKYDFEKLALLHEHGKLGSFLEGRNDKDKLGGWLQAMLPFYGAKAVGEHNLWPYFARRFGLEIVGFMEPKPGVPPTTKHLTELLKTMKASNVKLILSAPYYDPKHAAFVAAQSGARIAAMAHQTGSRPGANDYLAMVDLNVREVVNALKSGS
jgi:ABC-type Zn uptake system ZnuABC Zn-binding protein ZnuA